MLTISELTINGMKCKLKQCREIYSEANNIIIDDNDYSSPKKTVNYSWSHVRERAMNTQMPNKNFLPLCVCIRGKFFWSSDKS